MAPSDHGLYCWVPAYSGRTTGTKLWRITKTCSQSFLPVSQTSKSKMYYPQSGTTPNWAWMSHLAHIALRGTLSATIHRICRPLVSERNPEKVLVSASPMRLTQSSKNGVLLALNPRIPRGSPPSNGSDARLRQPRTDSTNGRTAELALTVG